MNAESILSDLQKCDFPRKYRSRFAEFGTTDTDYAAAEAAGVSGGDLQSKEAITDFLHSLWRHTSNALDHADFKPEHRPALEQLEVELRNFVTILRGETLPNN